MRETVLKRVYIKTIRYSVVPPCTLYLIFSDHVSIETSEKYIAFRSDEEQRTLEWSISTDDHKRKASHVHDPVSINMKRGSNGGVYI